WGSVDPDRSTIDVTPTQGLAADGRAAAAVTVTLRTASGRPVPGQTVVLSADGAGSVFTQPAAVTDTGGVASGACASTAAGVKTLTVTADPSGHAVVLNAHPTVSFDAHPVKLGFVMQPMNAVAGALLGTVGVAVLDADGNTVDTAPNVSLGLS